MSVDGVWTIWVCEDPECDDWSDLDGERPCTNYRAHPLGDYPDMVPVDVMPVAALREWIGDNDGHECAPDDPYFQGVAATLRHLSALLDEKHEGTGA